MIKLPGGRGFWPPWRSKPFQPSYLRAPGCISLLLQLDFKRLSWRPVKDASSGSA
jgi:hypothetical protein